ncbi:MAG: hypothetical protein KGH87_08025, partial [Thaumarchaeota archaeon]|nr:hypothetical protein [Nitrososphaerota archaeon]
LTTGQIVTLTDRVRHMPVPQGEDTPGFGHFLNSAYNIPIQSLASDVTGSAIIDVEEALCNEYGISAVEMHKGLLSHEWPEMPLLINEVHDELVFDVPPMVNQEQSTELILEMMKSVPTLRRVCPAFTLELGIEHLIAPTWGEKS